MSYACRWLIANKICSIYTAAYCSLSLLLLLSCSSSLDKSCPCTYSITRYRYILSSYVSKYFTM